MARTMCVGTGKLALIDEVSLPTGEMLVFGRCAQCGYTPEKLVLGICPPVRGLWLLPYHEIAEGGS